VIRECTIVPHFPDLGVCRSLGTVQYREVIVGTPPAARPHRLQVCHSLGWVLRMSLM
jgi:hypothetical protein